MRIFGIKWEKICSYIFLYHIFSILNISLMIFYTFSCYTWVFYTRVVALEHEQVAIIGLMLSMKALSCQCGTNEPSGSGFQAHSIGSGTLVSISLSFQKEPAWIHARFICWRTPDRAGTSILWFALGVVIRWSVYRIFKDAFSVNPYAS